MKHKRPALSVIVVMSLAINLLAFPFAIATTALAAALPLIDDFESGLPSGTDGDGAAIGFITFRDSNSSVAISTTASPPAPAQRRA